MILTLSLVYLGGLFVSSALLTAFIKVTDSFIDENVYVGLSLLWFVSVPVILLSTLVLFINKFVEDRFFRN